MKKGRLNLKSLLFYLLGFALLGFLLSRMDLKSISVSLHHVGWGMLLVFMVAPSWFFFNALSMWNLVKHRIGILDLMFNQIVGESLNALIPLAGLAGEPYKTKHLTRWIPLDEASRAIVDDKLIHILAGNIFTSLSLFITWICVPMPTIESSTVLITAIATGVVSFFVIFLTLSRHPAQWTGAILKRFKLLSDFRATRLPRKTFLISLFHKMVGRILMLIEVDITFRLLGHPPTLLEIVAVLALVSASGVIFFFIPQGLGVNEGAAIKAFILLGMEGTIGASFAIIRRARVVFWALAGLMLYAIVTLAQKSRGKIATGGS